jgi:preprotein translocase subunit Sec61beta
MSYSAPDPKTMQIDPPQWVTIAFAVSQKGIALLNRF